MKATVLVSHPEWLQIPYEGKISYGYNQEWYTTDWQRLAGCGPTTATQILNYVSFRDGYLEPEEFKTKEKVLEAMELVWPYVQPRRGGGLFKTRWLYEGLVALAKERHLPYTTEMLRILPFIQRRPPVEEIEDFMRRALENDAPIAFLNRHKGSEDGLQTWHWVPIVGLKKVKRELFGIVYDDELEKSFSMNKWLASSIFGGGLVYMSKN